MKSRVSFLVIVLLVVAGVTLSYAESQEEMLRMFDRDVTKEMPPAEAVANFNQKYPDANPLTEEEVVASIRGWDRKAHPVNNATYALYLRVAEERILPRGMYFSRIPELRDSEYVYEVDWKDLTLISIPQDQKDPEIGFGYNYRIRARFISSRPLTAKEKEERKNQLKQLMRSKEINREMIEKEKQKE